MNKSVRLPDAQVISRYKVEQSSVTITSDDRYIVHEPVLIFEGGKTIIENCQLLCKADNRAKSGK